MSEDAEHYRLLAEAQQRELNTQRDVAKNEEKRADRLGCDVAELVKHNAALSAEREALKVELATLTVTAMRLTGDNERLRALWKADEDKGIAREKALETQLTELREAAEDARETLRQLGWKPTRLDAVLASLPTRCDAPGPDGSKCWLARNHAYAHHSGSGLMWDGGTFEGLDLSGPTGTEIALPTDPEERAAVAKLLLEGEVVNVDWKLTPAQAARFEQYELHESAAAPAPDDVTAKLLEGKR